MIQDFRWQVAELSAVDDDKWTTLPGSLNGKSLGR